VAHARHRSPLRGLRSLAAGIALGASLAAVAACGVGGKKTVAKTALDAMSDADRRESWEASAQLLDRHPDWVDELYASVRKHPATMNRFLADTTRDLADPALAKPTAELLASQPASLEEVLVDTIDSALSRPDARRAILRATDSRAAEMVDILTDDPKVVSKMLRVALDAIQEKPEARKGALAAVRQNRSRLVALVGEDPELVKQMGKELLRAAVKDDPALETILKKAKVID
jgi:hypothetical protein